MTEQQVGQSERQLEREHDVEPDALDEELACTHCGGEGVCEEGIDPLMTCPEDPHPCHACGGSGNREDQVIF